ncbi:MAG: recombinase family protein [Pseudomonadota bacterium]
MKTSFAYVRVSTTKQGDGASLDAQTEAIKSYAARNGITITEWFRETVTAAKAGRPEFNRLVRKLKARKADGVIFHKIDRSTRNYFDWAKINRLADEGITINVAVDDLDFGTRSGRLVADVQMAIGADYIRNLREEIKKSQNQMLNNGLYPFTPPLGYLANGKEYKGKPHRICQERGPLVKYALERYAGGQVSMSALLEEMKAHGLTYDDGRRIGKMGIESMLNNSFYAGIIHIKKTNRRYVGAHEPLITPETFEQIIAVKSGRKAPAVTSHSYPYRRLLKCHLCGRTLVGERQKGHLYYRCHTKGCATKCIHENKVEEAIITSYEEWAFSDADVQSLCDEWNAYVARQEKTSGERTLHMRTAEIKKRLDRLTDLVIDGVVDTETYQARREELEIKLATLDREASKTSNLAALTANLQKFLELMKNVARLHKSLKWPERRELLQLLTSNRSLSREKPYFEPSMLVQSARAVLSTLVCVHPRGAVRTFENLKEELSSDYLSAAFKLDGILETRKMGRDSFSSPQDF